MRWQVDVDLGSFPSVDDLLGQVRCLAQEYPSHVTLFSFGESRQGEALLALRLGDGPRQVLAYGFPQPDEPLGGVALLRLATSILTDPALREQFTWTLLPCVDPDGARRNEGWFSTPLDLETYARRHFRPPEGEQVEWTFPSTDPCWPWGRPLPETHALQTLLDRLRPQFLFPLHNALVGGAYAFLWPDMEDLAGQLAVLWQARGLPTHQGEPELPFAVPLGDGVYRLPDLAEIAAALTSQGIADPAGLLQCGAPAYLYVRRFGEVLTMVPELPLFAVPGIGDTRPADLTRRQVLCQVLAHDRVVFEQWLDFYTQSLPFLERWNPYHSALENHRHSTAPLLNAIARWLEQDVSLDRPANVAQTVDGLVITPYLRLLPLGMLLQALQTAVTSRSRSSGHTALLREIESYLEAHLHESLAALHAVPVPIALLVEAVVGMISLTIRASQNSRHMV